MIVEFSVTNFKCFREKTTISFIANTAVEGANIKPETLIPVNKFGIGYLVKSIVIYGANASGKSSLVADITTGSNIDGALSSFIRILDFSTFVRIGEANEISFYHQPFVLSDKDNNKETEFEVIFLSEDESIKAEDKLRAFKYLFSFNKERIVKEEFYQLEWSEIVKKNEEKPIFKRNLDEIETSEEYKEYKEYKDKVLPNKLFIGKLRDNNFKEANLFYDYFRKKIILKNAIDFLEDKNREFEELFENFKYATDKTIRKHEIIERPVKRHFINFDFQNNNEPTSKFEEAKDKILVFSRLRDDGKLIQFDPSLESEGTRVMLNFWSGNLFLLLKNNLLLWSDEIDRSLHPLLLKHLFETFFTFKNETGKEESTAQLLATTHDISLLDANIFRKDQIWFAEKDEDTGESKLYSLSHFIFSNETKPKNVLDEYVFGRFGAIPKI
jgi:AAA15 family ATPase/GTPase